MISSAVGGAGDFNSETKFSEDRSRDSKLKSFNAGQMSTGSNSDDSSKTSSSDSDTDSEQSSFRKKKIETAPQKQSSDDSESSESEGMTCRRIYLPAKGTRRGNG